MVNYTQELNARPTLITLMLREDHQKVRQLFDLFYKTTNADERRDLVSAALDALEVLAKLKEELIYPAWREQVEEQNLVDEALKEHQVVHALIKELKRMDPEDEKYGPTFSALSKHVLHHIKEEEGKMFPQAEKAELDWEDLTTHVMQRRQSLEQKPLWLLGVPVVFSSEAVRPSRVHVTHRSGG